MPILISRLYGLRLRSAHPVSWRYASTLSRKPSHSLPTTPARTRFAPSPTGYLHLGSLRTALYNYLLAKATRGQFVLRVEDTDQSRTVAGAEDRICDGLAWAGLQWDEGPRVGGPYGPYRQSERKNIYHEHAHSILGTEHAYRCFCSPERLNQLAESRSKLGLPTDYDRACAGIPQAESDERASKGEKFVVRLKAPQGTQIWHDLIYGKVGNTQKPKKVIRDMEGYDDPILIKSDGMPTYHFANVVDDHLMKITHVVRAVEWMPSTPKHLAIYAAFGWQAPAFAHVGLLQNEAGQKLSKRNFDADLQSYIEKGYSADALVNYVALLGWSHTQKSDVLPLPELINNFSMKFTKGNTIVKLSKLDFLQSQYSQRYAATGGPELATMIEHIKQALSERVGGSLEDDDTHGKILSLVRADAKNFTTAKAFVDRNLYIFTEPPTVPVSIEMQETCKVYGKTILDEFSQIPVAAWGESRLKSALDGLTSRMLDQSAADSEKGAQDARKRIGSHLSQYMRWALMGSGAGPPIVSTMNILGKEKALARLEKSNQCVL